VGAVVPSTEARSGWNLEFTMVGGHVYGVVPILPVLSYASLEKKDLFTI